MSSKISIIWKAIHESGKVNRVQGGPLYGIRQKEVGGFLQMVIKIYGLSNVLSKVELKELTLGIRKRMSASSSSEASSSLLHILYMNCCSFASDTDSLLVEVYADVPDWESDRHQHGKSMRVLAAFLSGEIYELGDRKIWQELNLKPFRQVLILAHPLEVSRYSFTSAVCQSIR